MGGVETAKGMGYQHAHAVLTAMDILGDESLGAIRVEGVDDVMDIEVHDIAGKVVRAQQIKVRAEKYTWGQAEILSVMRAWAALDISTGASFEFVTDGRLGPTGEKVREALDAAKDGQLSKLASLMGEPSDSDVCKVLARARIRQEKGGTEAILMDAEHQVRSMSPDATHIDSAETAREAINRLYRLLSERAGRDDSSQRVVKRDEIAEALGGLEHLAAADRWLDGVRSSYLEAAAIDDISDIVEPKVESRDYMSSDTIVGASSEDRSAVRFLDAQSPILFVGKTGTGKTTALRWLRKTAAILGRVVIVAHAETYTPNRLSSLVASAISDVLGRRMPRATGNQIIHDQAVLLVLDGVSEVPEEIRRALRDELRELIASSSGARVVLAGRDAIALATALPVSTDAETYALSDIDENGKRDLVCRALSAKDSGNLPNAHLILKMTRQIERSLGTAAGNPMLFRMALELINKGVSFEDRASIYSQTIASMALRGRTASIEVTESVLGILFAGLLDQEKRYANPLEWHRLLCQAVDTLRMPGLDLRVEEIGEAIDRSGIIVPIGMAQTRGPLHDSFADFLAGQAHANGWAELPKQFVADDAQRILFAAEIAGTDARLAERTATELPFLCVAIGEHDRRNITGGSLEEINTLLSLLVPETEEHIHVDLWRTDGRTVAFLRTSGEPRWLHQAEGRELFGTAPGVVSQTGAGPLTIAIRLWRHLLKTKLSSQAWLGPAKIQTLEHAATVLEQHLREESEHVSAIVAATVPAHHAATVWGELGMLGMDAQIFPESESQTDHKWGVIYRPSKQTTIAIRTDTPMDNSFQMGRTTVESMVREGALMSAAAKVRAAMNALTHMHWL